ncbi:hypothetical protein M378DRAFT_18997, partial [Amanita muscaria Koide BX008]
CRLDRYEQGCNYDGVSVTGRAKAPRKEAGKGKGKSRAIVKDDADEEGGSDSESSGEDGSDEELPPRWPKQPAGDGEVSELRLVKIQIELVDLFNGQEKIRRKLNKMSAHMERQSELMREMVREMRRGSEALVEEMKRGNEALVGALRFGHSLNYARNATLQRMSSMVPADEREESADGEEVPIEDGGVPMDEDKKEEGHGEISGEGEEGGEAASSGAA